MGGIPQFEQGNPATISLLPYQEEAVRRARKTALFVCEKSRRTGLTLAFAHDAVTIASAAFGAMDVYYLSYNHDMTREFMENCAQFCAQELSTPNADGKTTAYRVTKARIAFDSGKSINALPSSPRSLRGKQGMVIIDEAAFHDNLPEVLKAALALSMWGGRIAVISTHNGIENNFAKLVDAIRSGRQLGDVMRLTLTDAMEQGLYRCICKTINRDWSLAAERAWEDDLRKTYGDAAGEELDVIPARSPATWLDRVTIEAAMTPDYHVTRLALPPGLSEQSATYREIWMAEWIADNITPLIDQFDPDKSSYFGQDFARSSDLSVITAGQFDDDAVLQCRVMVEMRGVHFALQQQLLEAMCRAMPHFVAGAMDARGNGENIAESVESTFGAARIQCIKATPSTYRRMMPRLKVRIEDRTIAMPRDEGVVGDLRMIRMVDGVPRVIDRVDVRIDGAKSRRHGDTAIALMHLVRAAEEPEQIFEFLATGKRDSASDSGFTHELTFTLLP